VFGPGWSPAEPFTILFVGKLIPLHGLETVLAAARAAPELRFRLVGSGQLEHLVRRRPPNADWLPWVDYEQLPAELHRAGCALGVFGTSDKAQRVIPNKAFQALACGTPLVTADTPAARELLVDGESALLVPPGDTGALVAALRQVAGEPETAQRLAAGGRAAYEAHASEQVLGRRWRELLEQELERR
jgi:glycosyltransferase involved in cell wall biosynthesis